MLADDSTFDGNGPMDLRSHYWDLYGVRLSSALRIFYQRYRPDKITVIPEILSKYEGEEQELLRDLCDRFNVSPSQMQVFLDQAGGTGAMEQKKSPSSSGNPTISRSSSGLRGGMRSSNDGMNSYEIANSGSRSANHSPRASSPRGHRMPDSSPAKHLTVSSASNVSGSTRTQIATAIILTCHRYAPVQLPSWSELESQRTVGLELQFNRLIKSCGVSEDDRRAILELSTQRHVQAEMRALALEASEEGTQPNKPSRSASPARLSRKGSSQRLQSPTESTSHSRKSMAMTSAELNTSPKRGQVIQSPRRQEINLESDIEVEQQKFYPPPRPTSPFSRHRGLEKSQHSAVPRSLNQQKPVDSIMNHHHINHYQNAEQQTSLTHSALGTDDSIEELETPAMNDDNIFDVYEEPANYNSYSDNQQSIPVHVMPKQTPPEPLIMAPVTEAPRYKQVTTPLVTQEHSEAAMKAYMDSHGNTVDFGLLPPTPNTTVSQSAPSVPIVQPPVEVPEEIKTPKIDFSALENQLKDGFKEEHSYLTKIWEDLGRTAQENSTELAKFSEETRSLLADLSRQQQQTNEAFMAKIREQELKSLNASLDAQVQDLTEKLESTNEELTREKLRNRQLEDELLELRSEMTNLRNAESTTSSVATTLASDKSDLLRLFDIVYGAPVNARTVLDTYLTAVAQDAPRNSSLHESLLGSGNSSSGFRPISERLVSLLRWKRNAEEPEDLTLAQSQRLRNEIDANAIAAATSISTQSVHKQPIQQTQQPQYHQTQAQQGPTSMQQRSGALSSPRVSHTVDSPPRQQSFSRDQSPEFHQQLSEDEYAYNHNSNSNSGNEMRSDYNPHDEKFSESSPVLKLDLQSSESQEPDRSADPGDWEEHVDPKTHLSYYFSPSLGRSSWKRPSSTGSTNNELRSSQQSRNVQHQQPANLMRQTSPLPGRPTHLLDTRNTNTYSQVGSERDNDFRLSSPHATANKPFHPSPQAYTSASGTTWIEAVDPKSNRSYWYNTETKISTWTIPEELLED